MKIGLHAIPYGSERNTEIRTQLKFAVTIGWSFSKQGECMELQHQVSGRITNSFRAVTARVHLNLISGEFVVDLRFTMNEVKCSPTEVACTTLYCTLGMRLLCRHSFGHRFTKLA